MVHQGQGSDYRTAPTGTFVGPDDNPDLYELIRHIGVGGEAQVWLAKTRPDPASPVAITVAVKVFHVDSPTAQAEWLRRTQALAHVRNPGLAQTLYVFVGAPMHASGEVFGQDTQRYRYLVMEYVDGPSLQEWIEDNPDAPLRERFSLLGTVAAALDALHAGTDTIPSLAHGDIKPDNARLTADGGVKLVDFGLMRMQGTARGGPAMASIPYTAPEIFSAGADAMPTPATDRFSFAATVFHVLTGQVPPLRVDGRGPDPAAMRPVLEASPLTAGRPEIADAVLAGLAAGPADRPVHLAQWLGGARSTSGVPMTTRTATAAPGASGTPGRMAGPSRGPQGKRRGRIIGVAVAAVVLVLAVGGWALAARGGGEPSATGSRGSTASTVGTTTPSGPTSSTGAPTGTDSPTSTDSSSATTTSSGTAGSTTTDPGTASESPVISSTFGTSVLLASEDAVNAGSVASRDGMQRSTQIPINGRSFDTGFITSCYYSCGPASIDLNVERQYSTFTARLGVRDDSVSGKQVVVKILTDGQLVLTRTVALGVSYDITVPIKGVLRIQILVGAYNVNPPMWVSVGDPTAVQ